MKDPAEDRKKLFTVFVAALLYQLFFLVICTVYHDLIIISDPLFRPPSPEQWERFWQIYRDVDLPHSVLVGSIGIFANFYGLIKFPWESVRITRKHAQGSGKKKCWAVIGLSLTLTLGLYISFRSSADPYYFHMSCIIPEGMSLMYLILFLWMRRAERLKAVAQSDEPAAD